MELGRPVPRFDRPKMDECSRLDPVLPSLISNVKSIVRRVSGRDRGKPYDGLAVLQEMGDSIGWLYTENSPGKTTRYRTVERVVDRNHIRSSMRRADETVPTMSSVRRRVVRVSDKTDGDSSSVTSSGPDVDLIKNRVESWRSGDIDRWRSYYAKEAKYRQNDWGKMAPIAELDALRRSFHKKLKGKPTIGKAIYGVITTKDGTNRAHLWFEAEVRFKSGEVVTNVVLRLTESMMPGKSPPTGRSMIQPDCLRMR